jgi:hypothetical protein
MSIDKTQIRLSHTLCFMFSGKAGTGKTFSANLAYEWCKELGLKPYKVSFAYAVKNTAIFMGWDGQKDAKGRKLLQDIGKAGRSYDIDLWVKKAFFTIEAQVGYPYDVVFIDDWRFKNEIKYILDNEKLYKPISIRVNALDREILTGTTEYSDISETELDDYTFDWTIDNRKNCFFYRDDIKSAVLEEIRKYSMV